MYRVIICNLGKKVLKSKNNKRLIPFILFLGKFKFYGHFKKG